jgi:tRNA pseudouridine38-40 synthase
MIMRYVRLLIEYDGTNYHGWQSQKSGGTIQDVLKEKISNIIGKEVRLTSASRTDAGVHALDQVAAFGTDSSLETEVIMRALNAKLPPDIRILNAAETDRDFHPRYRAIKKSYFYIISEGKQQSAFLHSYVWSVKASLDLVSMSKAASFILGEHDFSSFRATGCGAKHPVRTVHAADISRLGELSFMTATIKGDFIKIRIEANSFLRHMVRNIVGTLVEVGQGRMSPDVFRQILRARNRTIAGPTAPAKGLFLEKVIY